MKNTKKKIRIGAGNSKVELEAEFLDNPASKAILKSLPVESVVKTWGDEIYFDTGITAPAETPTLDVEIGDIAYWPEGRALCIFFGPTPISSRDKPVPASEVVIVGRAFLDPAIMRAVKPGVKIRLG